MKCLFGFGRQARRDLGTNLESLGEYVSRQ